MAPTDAGDVLVDPAPHVRDPDAGRRGRKKQRTRDDLLAAGDHLFSTRGFDETTTADIAERADVSQRTLFRHFPTKESLLYGDLDDARFLLRRALAERPASEPILTVVKRAMLSLAEDFERNRDRRLLQARLAATSPTVSAYSRAIVQFNWEREIIAAVADRLGVDPMHDPRPEIIAGAAMSAARIAMRQWTASGGTADFMELNAAALTAIEHLSELA